MMHPHLRYAITQRRIAELLVEGEAYRKAARSHQQRPRHPSLRTWAGWTLVKLGFRLLEPVTNGTGLTPQTGDG